jgi:hypothetical protein
LYDRKNANQRNEQLARSVFHLVMGVTVCPWRTSCQLSLR